jgi:hypothetical protein
MAQDVYLHKLDGRRNGRGGGSSVFIPDYTRLYRAEEGKVVVYIDCFGIFFVSSGGHSFGVGTYITVRPWGVSQQDDVDRRTLLSIPDGYGCCIA